MHSIRHRKGRKKKKNITAEICTKTEQQAREETHISISKGNRGVVPPHNVKGGSRGPRPVPDTRGPRSIPPCGAPHHHNVTIRELRDAWAEHIVADCNLLRRACRVGGRVECCKECDARWAASECVNPGTGPREYLCTDYIMLENLDYVIIT